MLMKLGVVKSDCRSVRVIPLEEKRAWSLSMAMMSLNLVMDYGPKRPLSWSEWGPLFASARKSGTDVGLKNDGLAWVKFLKRHGPWVI